MMRILFVMCACLGFQSVVFAVNNDSRIDIRDGTSKQSVIDLKRAEVEAALGRKLKVRERAGLWLVQRKLNKAYAKPEKTKKKGTGMAIGGFVLGIIGVLAIFLVIPLLWILLIPGFILSMIALIRSIRDPDEYGGRGMAIAGVVVNGAGLVSILLAVFIVLLDLV